jgi:aminoglycoside 2''-phosphotransferase
MLSVRGTSTRTLVKIIEQQFPSLSVSSAERILTGWDNVVLDINNRIIFRFPRFKAAEKSLEREIKLLSSLPGRLSVPIPDYKYIAPAEKNQFSFAGYKKIPGNRVTIGGYRLAWTRNLARGLAGFLRQLHTTKITGRIAQTIPRQGSKEKKRILDKHRAQIHALAYKYLDRKTRKLSESFFEDSVERFEKANYEPVLVHGDLTTNNILVDPNSAKLAGVLDWGDSRITDPALDFCGLFEINRHLGRETLALYAERSRDFLGRVEVYWRMLPYFEILYGIFSGSDQIRNLGISRLHRRLEAASLVEC